MCAIGRREANALHRGLGVFSPKLDYVLQAHRCTRAGDGMEASIGRREEGTRAGEARGSQRKLPCWACYAFRKFKPFPTAGQGGTALSNNYILCTLPVAFSAASTCAPHNAVRRAKGEVRNPRHAQLNPLHSCEGVSLELTPRCA